MSEVHKKIRKVEPIIKMRQKKLDDEALELARVREEKRRIVALMKDSQRRYLEGCMNINELRGSEGRTNIATMESAMDFVKEEWHRLMVQVREAERKEAHAVNAFLAAERELRAIESLKDKYVTQARVAEAKKEQQALDEHALRQYIKRNQ